MCVCAHGSKRILGPLELELGGCEIPNLGARAAILLNCHPSCTPPQLQS